MKHKMTLRDIARLLDAEVLTGEDKLDTEAVTACGSDLMSDVLAFVKDKTILITGLVNAVELRLTTDEIAYLEEPYVPHALVGVMAQNHG